VQKNNGAAAPRNFLVIQLPIAVALVLVGAKNQIVNILLV